MRILFTGVGRRIELLQAFRSAALVLKKALKLYGADLTNTAPALAYCDYARIVPSMHSPDYIDALLEICREDRIDLVIPTIDTDLLVLSENKERFEEAGARVLISAPDKIRICRDKNVTAHFFEECGLKTPHPSNDLKDYRGGFPAFIKPKDGSSSINTFRANNAEELAVLANGVENYIIQPFVKGNEYSVDIFCDWDGKPLSIIPRERLQVRAGEVMKTRIAMDPQIIHECERLCQAFSACGPLTVQLIRDEKGTDWFIEINPRYGGGTPLSMKAGARSAEAILKLLEGETPEPFDRIEDGAVYSRFDQSVSIVEGIRKVKGILFDLDDTLYSEKDYVRSGFRAVSDYLGGGYEEALWAFFDAGEPAIDKLLEKIGREEEKEAALHVYRMHKPSIRLYEEAGMLLTKLKSAGIKVGVLTDGRPEGQKNKLEALGLSELLDDVLITDELGGPQFRKPCDIAFRIIENRWMLPASEIVYVGDNPEKDFIAPRQLGMKSVWFRNKDRLYTKACLEQDHCCIDALTELPTVLGLRI